MRRRFIQDSKTGELREVESCPRPDHNGTFQVGDIPDMMKDVERRKADAAKADKRDRLNTLIRAVNHHTGYRP